MRNLLLALSAYFNIILLIRLRLRLAYPLHKCNFAVLQSKIAAVGSKAKFHIKPRSDLMREAFTCNFLHIYYQVSFTRIHFLSHQTKHPAIYTGIGASVYSRGCFNIRRAYRTVDLHIIYLSIRLSRFVPPSVAVSYAYCVSDMPNVDIFPCTCLTVSLRRAPPCYTDMAVDDRQ